MSRGEIEYRIDPSAYHPDRLAAVAAIESMSFQKTQLRYIAKFVRFASQADSYVGLEHVASGTGQLLDVGKSSDMTAGNGFEQGDVLFPKLRPYLNKVWLASFEGSCSTEFYVLRAANAVLPDYLAIILRSSFVVRQTSRLMTGATLPRLQTEDVHRLRLPIPDLTLQKKIIDVWDAAVAIREKGRNEASRSLAGIDHYLLAEFGINLPPEPENTIANRIFTAQRRELEQRFDPAYFGFRFSRIQHTLEAMPHTRLRDVAFFSSEQWDQGDDFGEVFPYLEISAIDTRTGEVNCIDSIPVEVAPSRARMLIRESDILVSTTRPNRGAITLVGSDMQTPLVASTGFSVIRHVDESRITKEFLLILLRSRLCLLQFEQRSSGGNYPAITQSELGRVLLPSATLAIQRKIVAHVQSLQAEAKRLRQQAETELEAAKRRIEAMLLGDAA